MPEAHFLPFLYKLPALPITAGKMLVIYPTNFPSSEGYRKPLSSFLMIIS
jgi:hypothetical protein